jgi:ribonuclease PH
VSKSLLSSYHVCTVSGNGELLVVESEGDFEFEDLEKACAEAEKECGEIIERLKKGWKR